MPDALFDFNRNAIAAELSSSTDDEYLVYLDGPWTASEPPIPGFVTVRSEHPALEQAARRIDIPFERGMAEVPVEVVIEAVEHELKAHGCRLAEDAEIVTPEILARWTWPALT
jgi:hypothetical protein